LEGEQLAAPEAGGGGEENERAKVAVACSGQEPFQLEAIDNLRFAALDCRQMTGPRGVGS
jgi:hypothetical protein